MGMVMKASACDVGKGRHMGSNSLTKLALCRLSKVGVRCQIQKWFSTCFPTIPCNTWSAIVRAPGINPYLGTAIERNTNHWRPALHLHGGVRIQPQCQLIWKTANNSLLLAQPQLSGSANNGEAWCRKKKGSWWKQKKVQWKGFTFKKEKTLILLKRL